VAIICPLSARESWIPLSSNVLSILYSRIKQLNITEPDFLPQQRRTVATGSTHFNISKRTPPEQRSFERFCDQIAEMMTSAKLEDGDFKGAA